MESVPDAVWTVIAQSPALMAVLYFIYRASKDLHEYLRSRDQAFSTSLDKMSEALADLAKAISKISGEVAALKERVR